MTAHGSRGGLGAHELAHLFWSGTSWHKCCALNLSLLPEKRGFRLTRKTTRVDFTRKGVLRCPRRRASSRERRAAAAGTLAGTTAPNVASMVIYTRDKVTMVEGSHGE